MNDDSDMFLLVDSFNIPMDSTQREVNSHDDDVQRGSFGWASV